jgi:hypothetical protein
MRSDFTSLGMDSFLADDFRTFLHQAALLRVAFKGQTIGIHYRSLFHSWRPAFDERL